MDAIVLSESLLPIKFTRVELSRKELKLYNSEKLYSAIFLEIDMERSWNYYLYTVIIPSLLFTFASYIGFWIDKNGTPGRTYLGSLAILNNINAYILPKVSRTTWLGNFLLG